MNSHKKAQKAQKIKPIPDESLPEPRGRSLSKYVFVLFVPFCG
jgi:hypothetical protein